MERLGDPFTVILQRLSMKDLLSLSATSRAIQAQISELDNNQLFWYGRTCSFFNKTLNTRPEGPWKQICFHLHRTNKRAKKLNKYLAGMSCLDTLKVLLEVHGTPSKIAKIVSTEKDLGSSRCELVSMCHIESAAVFEYLLQIGLVIEGTDTVSKHARVASSREMEAMILLAEEHTPGHEYRRESVTTALEYGRLDLFLALTEEYPELACDTQNLHSACTSNNRETVEHILGRVGCTREDITTEVPRAIIGGQSVTLSVLLGHVRCRSEYLKKMYIGCKGVITAPCIRALLNNGLQLLEKEWKSLLCNAIKRDNKNIIALTLEHHDPSTSNNEALFWTIQSGTWESFEMILEDPRVQIDESLLSRIVQKMRGDRHCEYACALLRSDKIDVDTLSDHILNTFYNLLARGTDYPREEFVSPSSAYWKVRRFMYTREPDSETTLQYIRDCLLHEREVKEALACVLSGSENRRASPSASVFRGLFLFLIYDKMTRETSARYLREDGYSDRQIHEVDTLIDLLSPASGRY